MKFPDTRTQQPVLSFLGILVIFEGVGGFLGWVSGPGMDGWYDSLIKSPFNPPPSLFGIVWPALYALLAFSFWRVWRGEDSRARTTVLRLFGFHMILNWLWSPLFFIAHEVYPAFILILVLIFTASMLLWLIWPLSRAAALIFIPYLGWLIFAGHLNHFISQANL